MFLKTLIFINPRAAGGQAVRLWHGIESEFSKAFGTFEAIVTESPEDVVTHLHRALPDGVERVISVGGDGTNHALINVLVEAREKHPQTQIVYGNLPIGTGNDWARAIGVPRSLPEAVQWLANARPQLTDVGMVIHDTKQEYFLNIASAGIGGEVSKRVNAVASRKPWTFLASTVLTLLTYQPREMKVLVNGQKWYEGSAYIAAVANGNMFGHGMNIAPNAVLDDGGLDVVLVEGMARIEALFALRTVYSGDHLKRSDVHSARANEIVIESTSDSLDFEMDGESAKGARLSFTVLPQCLWVLR